jgi:hypothetical protein
MPKNALIRMGFALFVAITVGGTLYLLSITLEDAPLYNDLASSVASDVTNVGYPP